MSKYYRDYLWKDGVPCGIGFIETPVNDREAYKIIADPYRKRISIERYIKEQFDSIIYDSAFLDFRSLKPAEQVAWQKNQISEAVDNAVCLIRNQDDRLVLKEVYSFQGNRCRKCQINSPHGILLAVQELHYTTFGDPFNRVVLIDSNNHPVMFKTYEIDETTGEFTKLLEEHWDMEKQKINGKR